MSGTPSKRTCPLAALEAAAKASLPRIGDRPGIRKTTSSAMRLRTCSVSPSAEAAIHSEIRSRIFCFSASSFIIWRLTIQPFRKSGRGHESNHQTGEHERRERERHPEVAGAETKYLKGVHAVREDCQEGDGEPGPFGTASKRTVHHKEQGDAAGHQGASQRMQKRHEQPSDARRKSSDRLANKGGPGIGWRADKEVAETAQDHHARAGIQQQHRGTAA